MLIPAVLFNNGYDVWLPGQIVFWPIIKTDGTALWILDTKYGPMVRRDNQIMAVNIIVWVQCWMEEKDLVSASLATHADIQYRPAYIEHRKALDLRRRELLREVLGYVPHFPLPDSNIVLNEFNKSCHMVAARVLRAHDSGAAAPDASAEVERVMDFVRMSIAKLFGEETIGQDGESSTSSTSSEAGSPPAAVATSPAQVFDMDEDIEDAINSTPALESPSLDEAATEAEYFDPRATLDTPPLSHDSSITINESAGPITPSADTLITPPLNDSTTAINKGPIAPALVASQSDAVANPAVDTNTTLKVPATAVPIPTGPRPPATPFNSPVSPPKQGFRKCAEADGNNPGATSNPAPVIVPAAFAAMNQLSQAERAVRLQNADSNSSNTSTRSTKTKPFSTEYPFGVPIKAAPSVAEVRRRKSVPVPDARPAHPRRTQSAPKPSVRFADQQRSPQPKPRGYLRPMYPQPKPKPPPPPKVEEPKPEPFTWHKLDSFGSRIEDFPRGLKRQQTWNGTPSEPAKMERGKSEGAKPAKPARKPSYLRPLGSPLVLTPSQPRPYRYAHAPPRPLFPSSLPDHTPAPPLESQWGRSPMDTSQWHLPPSHRLRPGQEPPPTPRRPEPVPETPVTMPFVGGYTYAISPMTSGWSSSGLSFSQARRERMPVRMRRHLGPLTSERGERRERSEGSGRGEGSGNRRSEGNAEREDNVPQSQRQGEDNAEWAEMDVDNRSFWRDLLSFLCGMTKGTERET